MNKSLSIVCLCLTTTANAQVLNEAYALTVPTAGGFGSSVAMSGDLMVVGAEVDGQVNPYTGAAFIYNAGTGEQLHRITAEIPVDPDGFGGCVSISGENVLVGLRERLFGSVRPGSAYIFDATTGQQLFRLSASDFAQNWDRFGDSVAISEDTAVVGAPGSVNAEGIQTGMVFVFNATNGQLIRTLESDESEFRDFFGDAVALSGTTALVGAPEHGTGFFSGGAAYLFDVSTGELLHTLIPQPPEHSAEFGKAVAISGDLAIVGAARAIGDGSARGVAYVFRVSTGELLYTLSDSSDSDTIWFGRSVAITGNLAVVGAGTIGSNPPGVAFVYDLTTGERVATLASSAGSETSRFGDAVAISNNRIAVGDLLASTTYVFDLTPPECPGDIADEFGSLTPDNMVGFGDFLALLGLVGSCPGGTPGCTGDIADDFGILGNPDAQVSFGDFLALLGVVGPCP